MIDRPITIIAEIGINHNGDMILAKKMIEAAVECGADVTKFQIYVPERVLDCDHLGIKRHWSTIKATELSFEDVCLLKDMCDDIGIEFLASVFHPDRVVWTEKIGMERYKIASRSIYDEKLAQAIFETGKPIILSYGWWKMGRTPPISRLTGWGRRVSRLYCVSQYPTSLSAIHMDRGTFNAGSGSYDGFSDHAIGITASVVAMSLGAKIIEKHFTLDKNMSGFDHAWSIEPDELRHLCNMRDDIEEILWNTI